MSDIISGSDGSGERRVGRRAVWEMNGRGSVTQQVAQVVNQQVQRVETITGIDDPSERQSSLAVEVLNSRPVSQRGSVQHTSRSSRLQVFLPAPTSLNKKMIKDLEVVVCGGQSSCDPIVMRLLESIDRSPRQLALYLYQRGSSEQLLFVEYCQARRRYRLSREDEVLLFDESTNLKGSVLYAAANKFLKFAGTLNLSLLADFKNSLVGNVLVAKEKQDTLVFSHMIRNSNEAMPLVEFQRFAAKYSLEVLPEFLEPIYSCSSRLELVSRLLELEHRTTGNRHCRQHTYVVLSGEGCDGGQYVLPSREQLLFENMMFGIITNSDEFLMEQRCYFPCVYYAELYQCLRSLPECALEFNQRIKVMQYCKEENYSLQQVIVSPYLPSIAAIAAEEFQNYDGGTYLIYLIVGPVGLGKSDLLEAMRAQAENFGCYAITLSRSPDYRLGIFDREDLEMHFRRHKHHFTSSRNCIILVDYPFYEQLPEQLAEAVERLCPLDCHYKVYHVMPQTEHQLRFQDDIIHRDIEFPFSPELIVHCLRSIQERKNYPGLNGNGVESLARAIHYTCSAFKNYRPESHDGYRQKLIRVPFQVQFEDLRPNLVRYLQQLLSVSYKREYDRNENLLHFFLSEIEELAVTSRPDLPLIADLVFSRSFHRLPYYPLD